MIHIGFRCVLTLAVLASALSLVAAPYGGAALAQAQVTPHSPIKVGASLQITGFGAVYGDWARKSLTFGVEEVNEAGGVLGRRLELVVEDNRTEVKEAVTTYDRLTKVEKVAITFCDGSPFCLAQGSLAMKDKVLLINAMAGNPNIRKFGFYVVSTRPDFADNVKPLPPFLWKRGYKRVAMMFADNDIGRSCRDPFIKNFEALGGAIVADEGYLPGQTDFRAQLTKAKGANSDAIMYCGDVTEVALHIKQMPQLGMGELPKFSIVSLETPRYWEIAGAAGEGLMLSSFAFSKDLLTPEGLAWWNRWNARFHEDPTVFALTPYVGVKLLAEAMKRCQCTDPTGVATAWRKIRDFPTPLGPASVDEDGYLGFPMAIKIATNGQFKLLKD